MTKVNEQKAQIAEIAKTVGVDVLRERSSGRLLYKVLEPGADFWAHSSSQLLYASNSTEQVLIFLYGMLAQHGRGKP